MSFNLRGVVVAFLAVTLKALEPKTSPASAANGGERATALSAPQLGSLGTLLGLLPVSDLIDIVSGHATWDNALDAAAHGADIVRAVFPPAAMTAQEVKLALEALRFILDAAGVGPTPFRIEPGQNPIRGGWSGARGHV
ncbi:MAG: hypothetical protein KGM15_09920 [Pseudomonadota bacterium]|nr:hypothetical protein [Pseudomonadota bacterium]